MTENYTQSTASPQSENQQGTHAPSLYAPPAALNSPSPFTERGLGGEVRLGGEVLPPLPEGEGQGVRVTPALAHFDVFCAILVQVTLIKFKKQTPANGYIKAKTPQLKGGVFRGTTSLYLHRIELSQQARSTKFYHNWWNSSNQPLHLGDAFLIFPPKCTKFIRCYRS
jgi:hypothetical protein